MPLNFKSPQLKIFFVAAVLITLSIYFLKDSITLFPSFIHAWTQSDRYALALGFLNNGFDFFHPQTFNLATVNGITRVDFPIHEYLVAIIMKLSGIHEPVVFRAYTLIYGLAGLIFLFRLSGLFNESFIKNLIVVVFLFLCPVFLYYLDGFIPSIPSLANTFIGYYFYFRHKRKNSLRDFRLSLLFLTLAAMARQPFFIFLFAVFCQEIFEAVKKKQWSKDVLATFAVSFLFFFGYQLYNYYLGRRYGSQFLNSFLTAHSLDQFKDWCGETWEHWRFHYLTPSHYLILGGLTLIFLLQAARRKNQSTLLNSLLLQALITLAGCVIYFILMIKQFPDHDYYFIDSFYVALMLLLVAVITSEFEIKWLNYGLILVILFLLSRSSIEAREIMNQRYEKVPWDRAEITRENFWGSEKFLDSIGVSKQAKVLTLDAYTTNIPLMLMNRKGWTLHWTKKEFIDSMMTKPFDIVALQNSFVVSDVLRNDADLLTQLEKFADNGGVGFYKRKNKPGQTMNEFLGLEEHRVLAKDSDSFEMNDSTKWWSKFQVTDEKYFSGQHSLLVGGQNESAGLINNAEYKMTPTQVLKVLVTGKILLEKSKAPSLVAALSSNDIVYSYNNFDLADYTTNSDKWQDLMFQFVIRTKENVTGKLSLYFWNNRGGNFYLDDLNIITYR